MYWINLIILYKVRILQYRPEATRTSEGSGTMCLCEIINPRNVSDAPTVKFCCCHRTLLSSIEKRKGLYPPILFILTVAFFYSFQPPHFCLLTFTSFHTSLNFFEGPGPPEEYSRALGHLPWLPHPLWVPGYIYYYIFCYIYYYNSLLYILYRVSHVNAHAQFLGHLEKSFFHLTCLFACVPLFADRFRHLSDGFRPYNIVDSTLTSGLRYRQHLTVL